jgi:hypothetical protein
MAEEDEIGCNGCHPLPVHSTHFIIMQTIIVLHFIPPHSASLTKSKFRLIFL